MPRSTAARSRAVISCLSLGGPYEKLIPMQPSPMAETSRLLFPSLRFCIVFPLPFPPMLLLIISECIYSESVCLSHAPLLDLFRFCSKLRPRAPNQQEQAEKTEKSLFTLFAAV